MRTITSIGIILIGASGILSGATLQYLTENDLSIVVIFAGIIIMLFGVFYPTKKPTYHKKEGT